MARLITAHFAIKDLSDTYANNGVFTSNNIFGDTNEMKIPTYVNERVTYAISPSNEIFLATRVQTYVGIVSTNQNYVFVFYSGATLLATIRFSCASHKYELIIGNNPYSGSVVASSNSTFPSTSIQTLECRFKLDDSTGVCQLKVDGVLEIDFSGDTKPGSETTFDNVGVAGAAESNNFPYYSWFVCNDLSGGADNSWPGLLKFKTVFPNADGNAISWTASAGNRYACVDENPPNGETDYIISTLNAQRNSFSFPAHGLPSNATIRSITGRHIIRKETAGTITPYFRVGSTNYDGSSIDPPTSYKAFNDRRTQNPNTSAAWALTDTPEIGVLSGGM